MTMEIVSFDSKYAPLLDQLARLRSVEPIRLAVGQAPSKGSQLKSAALFPPASSNQPPQVVFNIQPPVARPPVVLSEFMQHALAQANFANPPATPRTWQPVRPSEALLALVRQAQTAPAIQSWANKDAGPRLGATLKTGGNDAAGYKLGNLTIPFGFKNPIIPQPPVQRHPLGQIWADPQKANERVLFAGEAVDLVGKLFPQLGLPIEALGEIVNVAGVITGTVGIVDAFQRGDRGALVGCSLTVGASALGLIGALSGNSSLATAGMIVKFSKSGWTCFGPSLPPTAPAKTPPSPMLGSVLGAPNLSSWTYDPASRSWRLADFPVRRSPPSG
jgi:hypothetical protein